MTMTFVAMGGVHLLTRIHLGWCFIFLPKNISIGACMWYMLHYCLMVVVSFFVCGGGWIFCLIVLVGCVNDGSCVFCFMTVVEFLC